MLKVGDQLYAVLDNGSLRSPPTGRREIVTVTKVGSRWATLSNGYKVYANADDLTVNNDMWNGPTYKGEIFCSQKEYDCAVGHAQLWKQLHWPSNKPRHVTKEQIEQISSILYANAESHEAWTRHYNQISLPS